MSDPGEDDDYFDMLNDAEDAEDDCPTCEGRGTVNPLTPANRLPSI